MSDAEALEVLAGTLDLLILRTLSWGPAHGYAIARWIRTSSDDTIRVQDGALYTALHRLAARELVEASWGHAENGKRARFYRLTPAGRRELRALSTQWERYALAMTSVLRTAPSAG